jgi:hypothetical protein
MVVSAVPQERSPGARERHGSVGGVSKPGGGLA